MPLMSGRFLRKAFGSAPSWFARPRLLRHATQQPDPGRLRPLVMPYSRDLERTNLAYENAWLRGVPLPA